MSYIAALDLARQEALRWDKTFFVLRQGSEFIVATTPNIEGAEVVTRICGIADALSTLPDDGDEDDSAYDFPEAVDLPCDDCEQEQSKPQRVIAVFTDDEGNVVDEWTWDDEVAARMDMFGAETEAEMWEAYENWSDRD